MKIDCIASLPSWHNLQKLFSVIAKVLFEFSNAEMISRNFSCTLHMALILFASFGAALRQPNWTWILVMVNTFREITKWVL